MLVSTAPNLALHCAARWLRHKESRFLLTPAELERREWEFVLSGRLKIMGSSWSVRFAEMRLGKMRGW
jgi:hypothetical protein